jgi:hypothetical protein
MAPDPKRDSADTKPMTEGETRELVEHVAWEVIPQLAEALLREELAKHLGD